MSCELSPSAAAFSTMLSAFIGSIINGLCSGWFIAFITGWISWLSVIRILTAGLYELWLTVKVGTDFTAINNNQYQNIELNGLNSNGTPAFLAAPQDQPARTQDLEPGLEETRNSPQTPPAYKHPLASLATAHVSTRPGKKPILGSVEQTVTAFGWLGWIWSAIYTPVSQTIWLSVHITSADGIHQFVRALAIGVSALGLTFDYKQRYAAALGRKWGSWAFVTFNVWNAAACLLLGVEALVLLIHGAMKIDNLPIPLAVVYPIFCVIWAAASWRFLPPIDGARPSNVIAGLLMGAFAGLFVAAPAFAIWQDARFAEKTADMMGESRPEGMGLGEFLQCEGASVWAKFAAVMP